ncbi:MAG: DUF4962 domain-containing protein [Pirellulales bacterium]
MHSHLHSCSLVGSCVLAVVIVVSHGSDDTCGAPRSSTMQQHPRLYFTADQLPALRAKRESGVPAKIWKNVVASAQWCRDQSPRSEWTPTIANDPQYENLYDRFYGAMHDMAIVEHLALTSALSDPDEDPFFQAARDWTLASARIWKNEAKNSPDASKAYAVLRVMKAIAVSYDVLYPRLSEAERKEIRAAIVDVGKAYFLFFQDPLTAGKGYNKHHGSVDAAPFGIMALALLSEAPEVEPWLDLAIKKHVDYLLPHALTPSGTSDQSSNFWASTLHYRIFFMDALRRTTGRDLFQEFPDSMPGRIALAAIARGQSGELRYNEDNRSVLFGPSYGQIDYWSPVLVFLARQQKRPIYQYLAQWDESLGALQHTRYITPTRREELLFTFGPYVYMWYDTSIAAEVERDLPLSFEFPEPEVNEAYLRASFRPGDIVVGMKKGGLVVHAGGRAVLVDQLNVNDMNNPASAVDEMLVADDGRLATIRCVGPTGAGLREQTVDLYRSGLYGSGRLVIRRETTQLLKWWYSGEASVEDNSLVWPDGTRLEVVMGNIESVDPTGFVETKVHYGGMEYADPHPFTYQVITVKGQSGIVEICVTTPKPNPSKAK